MKKKVFKVWLTDFYIGWLKEYIEIDEKKSTDKSVIEKPYTVTITEGHRRRK